MGREGVVTGLLHVCGRELSVDDPLVLDESTLDGHTNESFVAHLNALDAKSHCVVAYIVLSACGEGECLEWIARHILEPTLPAFIRKLHDAFSGRAGSFIQTVVLLR